MTLIDRSMIRWICGVKPDDDNFHNAPQNVTDCGSVLRTALLTYQTVRTFATILLLDQFCQRHGDPKLSGTGHRKKTWMEFVKSELNDCNLLTTDELVRDVWRAGVRHCCQLPTPDTGTFASVDI